MKERIIKTIKQTEFGNYTFYKIKDLLGKSPVPDLNFPDLISLELSSYCNLSCSHCPPQLKEYNPRKHSHMDLDLFTKLMDQIDNHGKRQIALHKDGEPLLHPNIKKILSRVKKNNDHIVYLTTNGHVLTDDIIGAILQSKVNIVNFSIGAATNEFYQKVRGKGFDKAISNIKRFLEIRNESIWKPKVTVQIIDIKEHKEMVDEIKSFKMFWKDFDVEVCIWEKLTWGEFDNLEFKFRYPCYSLWNSFNVNSNGIVTACCMDWKQNLRIGNVNEKTIEEIWKDESIYILRKLHDENRENEIAECIKCNYWQWQPMLMKYPLN